MPRRIRKQIYIDPEQERALKKLAKKTGRTEAEIMRSALGDYLERENEERLQAWQNILATIDERRRTIPTQPGERTWKREELYERGGRSD